MEDVLRGTIDAIRPPDEAATQAARARLDNLTKPQGSLGRLEDLAAAIAGMKADPMPQLRHKAIVTMAADHGVVADGVSAYPQEVTGQMVLNFLQGGAGINVLARLAGARVVVVDMGVAYPVGNQAGLLCQSIAPGTNNFAQGAAMTREQAIETLVKGIGIVAAEAEKGLDIVAAGDMGIGNTTCSAAICAVFTARPAAEVAGRGAGLDDAQLLHKIGVIERALEINQPDQADALDVLAKVGGFEIGGLAGVMLGAAARRIPIVLDGFNAGAAAMLASSICPMVKEYFIAGHVSAEHGHRAMLEHMRLTPLLDLGMRLGEGTGAALGIFLAEAAVRLMTEMATFGEAGVSTKSAESQ